MKPIDPDLIRGDPEDGFGYRRISRWERFCLLFHRVHISADDDVCLWFKIMGGRIYLIREERLR